MSQPPSCPLCGHHERTERHNGHWHCGVCWTLFSGGQDEWAAHRRHRELWKNTYEREEA